MTRRLELGTIELSFAIAATESYRERTDERPHPFSAQACMGRAVWKPRPGVWQITDVAAPFMIDPDVDASRRNTMFDTVVIGLDGSPESKRALPVALDLAKRDGGRIVAVHVREMLVGRAGGQPLNVNEDEVEAEVRRQIAEISSTGVDIGLTVVSAVAGGPAHVLADIARKEHADVIVIGTRGHSQITGLLVGSATHRLLHIAPCAVYVVPPVDNEMRK